jgi:hypothetical protein
LKVGSTLTASNAAEKWPDPYVAFNVNQAWGRVALAARAHDVSAINYTAAGTGPFAGVGCSAAAQGGTTQCLAPDDKVGWAAAAGAEFKMDFITPGDRLGMSIHGGVGHSAFSFQRQTGPGLFGSGNQVGFGWVTDGVYVNGSGIQLTTSWNAQVGYEHYWTPSLKTAFGAAYGEISYDTTASNWFATQMGGACAAAVGATGAATSTQVSASGVVGANKCSPNYQYFQGFVRTQWNVTKGFFLGVDVGYNQTYTAFKGAGSILAPGAQSGLRPTGVYTFKNEGEWVANFRALSAF